jgi:branched-chain amino acid transport system permease protein
MSDFINNYGFLLVSMILGAILGLSVYLPLMAGQLSLATPGFYALGGYIAAILSTQVFKFTGSLFPVPFLLLEMLIAQEYREYWRSHLEFRFFDCGGFI